MQAEFETFLQEVNLTAHAQGLLKSEAFFELYRAAATESGDIEEPDYCPVIHDARPAYRIDGYYLNEEEGELGLLICDFKAGPDLETINAADCDMLFVHALRFYQNALSAEFLNGLEDSSPAFRAAYKIHNSRSHVRRVRVIILTSGRLSMRKTQLKAVVEGGLRVTCSVLDFQRYLGIQSSKSGVDPIEIDLRENGLSPLPCLSASSTGSEYSSYMVVVPAGVLAEIYGLYGARLLESNVRTYLQARTKVNKGIQNTLRTEPRNFFAYNNGLTATASDVTVEHISGVAHLTRINDLQIVNGGQTTASILFARDKEKSSLDEAFVQMKLSVVTEAAIDELVPNISRFANSQNKISDADFFASHPFHLHMERMSRRITAPVREGAMVATKWFYERARGQYKDAQAYLTDAQKKKFLAEFPRDQMLVKTDLAKYELAFERQPYTVSLGAQKCFVAFAESIEKRWDPDASNFGDEYYRDAMARALIFRWTDKMVGHADWYKKDRAYKSQTVAYTLAMFSELLNRQGQAVDFRRIWNRQELPPSLCRFLEDLAPEVARLLRQAPENIRNISEYCKRPACWNRMSAAFQIDLNLPSDIVLENSEVQRKKKEARAVRLVDSGIDKQSRVVELGGGVWKRALKFANENRLGSPTERGVVEFCSKIPVRLPTEKQSLVAISFLSRLQQEGFEI